MSSSTFAGPRSSSGRYAFVLLNFLLLVACFTALIQPTSAKFTHATCWRNDCLQKNHRGAFCYYPSDIPDTQRYKQCSLDLRKVLERHIKAAAPKKVQTQQIPTTAYYDLASRKFMGGADYSVANAPQHHKLAVCHTGLVKDRRFFTTCRVARLDNDFGLDGAQADGCGREHGHDERVLEEECCGKPRAVCPPSQYLPWYRQLQFGRTEQVVAAVVSIAAVAIFARR